MKKSIVGVCVVLFGLICISGCKEKIYDSEYFFKNQDEAKTTIEKCKKGEVSNDNCANAQEALQKQAKIDWMKAHGGK